MHPAPGLPKILGISFITELSRVRDRMKHPHELSCARVVSVDVGWHGRIVIPSRWQRNDEQVFEYAPRIAWLEQRECIDVAIQADSNVHAAVVTKALNRSARPCVDGGQVPGIHIE